MIYFLSESEKKTAIKEYAGRQKTIIANLLNNAVPLQR